jgi:putative spermidine/putrescine transport system ATP-binding protein
MTVAVENVSFIYPGSNAGVTDIDLFISDGELIAVIGASGSGKTTLLKLVSGFEYPDRGAVMIAGQDVTHLPPKGRELGVVFQSYALFPLMTAVENVAYPLKVRGMPRKERLKAAREMLERVGLGAFADRRPGTLSGGQQQRVALARALVFRPKALLLDEPLSALDAALRIEMRDEIRRLQREHGIATLHITHDQEEALSMADRVAVMQQGSLLQVASPQELYDAPANRAVAAFVGHANLWNGTVSGANEVQLEFGPLRTEAHSRAVGESITVLVRPERIEVGPGPERINAFPCRLVRDRFLGSVRRFDAEINGIIVLGETSFRGEIKELHIPPGSVQLLPAESNNPK